jgi:hypothetical protein
MGRRVRNRELKSREGRMTKEVKIQKSKFKNGSPPCTSESLCLCGEEAKRERRKRGI